MADRSGMFTRQIAAFVVLPLLALGATPALGAPVITEFPAGSGPVGVTSGSDGNVWFSDSPNPGALGKITTAGVVSLFSSGLTRDGKPTGATAGPGGVWFTENAKKKIGRIAVDGSITEFPTGPHDKPVGITSGPDGHLWYTATGGGGGGAIARITPAGTVTEFVTGLTANGVPQSIALGPDGNLWFTAPGTRRVGRITPQGAITEFGAGILTGVPQEIAAGPDGNLWVTQNGAFPSIARITPTGAITEFSAGLPISSSPQGITAGADGNLYFTDNGANSIGQITTSGVISQFSAGLTASAGLRQIATGPDGRLWFAEQSAAKIGRMSVAPTAGATVASDVTDTTATVTASVSPNSQATTYSFEWGATSGYGQSTSAGSAGAGGTAQSAAAALTGLTPSTTYHVRVVATNATGTSAGPDRVFTTTAPGAPSATSMPATGTTAADATLNAVVNPENALTTYYFDWGTSPTPYANRAPAAPATVGADGVDHPVQQTLHGLEPNVTYHYRVVASSPSGTTYGADQIVTTDATAPGVSTSQVTNVSGSRATLNATINPNNSTTGYHFEWGPTTDYGASIPDLDDVAGSDRTDHVVSQTLEGLSPGTTYHYRVVASSNAGVTTGPDQVLTVPAAAEPPKPPLPPLLVTEDPAPSLPVAPLPVPAPAPGPVPQLGRTAVVNVASGTVRVRLPGQTASREVDSATSIPSGAIIDARDGTIELQNAVDGRGRTQRASFRGTTFRMSLSKRTAGLVDLTLTASPENCASRRPPARASRAQRPIKLWAKDSHGKFTTKGRNSVATVRGTEWTTTETCAGTVTRVIRGAVSVKDTNTGRTRLVRAGHAYLARSATKR